MDSKRVVIALIPIALSSCTAGENGGAAGTDNDTYATGRLPTAAEVQERAVLQAEGERPHAVSETVVGRALDAGGAIPDAERTEQFAPGEEIHVAVRVHQPPPQARVRIAWFGPDDNLLGEDARPVSADDEYVSFSMAGREASDPGEYRAEIWVDDEKVDERRFAVVSNGRSNAEEKAGG